jgi:hypothetical protein
VLDVSYKCYVKRRDVRICHVHCGLYLKLLHNLLWQPIPFTPWVRVLEDPIIAHMVLLIVIICTRLNEEVTEFNKYLKSLIKTSHLSLPLTFVLDLISFVIDRSSEQ